MKLQQLIEIEGLVCKHAPGRSDLIAALDAADQAWQVCVLAEQVTKVGRLDISLCEEEQQKEQAADGRRADGGEGQG